MADLSLRDLLRYIAEERGLDLRGYKDTTLERRLRRRMFQLKLGDFDSYQQFVRETPDEVNHLLNAVLINVTEFFRDPQAWQALTKKILPRIYRGMKTGDALRVWSAGCASGEEAYSAAITVSEFLGKRLKDFDVKIYATDVDDEALTTARQGEYPEKLLRRVPEEVRRKYFSGGKIVRVSRELRRLVIFGKSNLASDAPISHVHLLICRNALIYFEPETQQRILRHFHYALEPGGVLFLGRSESQVRSAHLFEPVDSKWRFFKRVGAARGAGEKSKEDDLLNAGRQELAELRQYYTSVLDGLDPGILMLDGNDTVMTDNDAVLKLWKLENKNYKGKSLRETEFTRRCPQLMERVEASKENHHESRFECDAPEGKTISVTVKPILAGGKHRAGTLIYMGDVSPREKFQTTIEALETTTEELQSANEELETTNEELQSTNEELETTNEELQSTNEELETTNEELQSLNEELETTNEELEMRGKELDHLNLRYFETLEHLPWPMLLADPEQNVKLHNSSASRLFGLAPGAVLSLAQLPLAQQSVNTLLGRFRVALTTRKAVLAKSILLRGAKGEGRFDAHFKPLSRDGKIAAMLIMLRPLGEEGGQDAANNSRRKIKRKTKLSRGRKRKR